MRRELDMAEDGAALLGEAGHVDHAAALAFEMRGHAEDGADGDDAGAADASDDHREAAVQRRHDRFGQFGFAERRGIEPERVGFLGLCAMDRDEGRAEALHAGKVLVAVRLVDLALAAEFGLQRLDRDAVRLHATIAAALADQLVDDHALVGVRVGAALAPPALLGGAGLVVEQERDAGGRGQFALDGVELVAMVQRRAGRPLRARRIFAGVVADDGDALHALGRDLPCHLVGREMPFRLLAAGHGDGVVVEQLVGEGNAGGDGPADRERAGMGIGAVAEILEDMAALRERRLADPVGAFAAHLGEAGGVAVHPLHHVMAADAGISA